MAQLAARIQLSQKLLDGLRVSTLPPGLGKLVQAGPISDTDWCILCKSSAASAKLRQWMPDIERQVEALLGRKLLVRLKVQTTTK